MSKSTHISVSVPGMLSRSDEDIQGLLVSDDGRELSILEIRSELVELLQNGVTHLKVGKCNNWSDTKGCLGHNYRPEISETY